MSQRVDQFIKIIVVLLISINLVNSINQQQKIREGYLAYINQEFDRELRLRIFNFQRQYVRSIAQIEKEDLLKIQKQQSVEKKNLSRGGSIQEETFVLTFYTSLPEENGYGPITCSGSKLRDGIVANNVLPQGTKISTKEFGELIVADRGGNNFNTRHRLDVFVSRRKGESDYQYKKRVNGMGIIKTKGYIIK